jgi:hypothetical protein
MEMLINILIPATLAQITTMVFYIVRSLFPNGEEKKKSKGDITDEIEIKKLEVELKKEEVNLKNAEADFKKPEANTDDVKKQVEAKADIIEPKNSETPSNK